MSLRLLHQANHELGSGGKKKISWSDDPTVKNQLKERLLSRNSPLCNGTENSNAAAGRRDSHHHFSTDFWRPTLSL
jgi:hypothetical protein